MTPSARGLTQADQEAGAASTQDTAEVARRRETVLVSGLASDSHTWNLVFLQLLIEEHGYDVVNLGPCVPDELLIQECLERTPAMLVLSSVNGHGHQDGLRLIKKLRQEDGLRALPAVIGGQLGITGGEDGGHAAELVAAGFDSVFEDGAQEIAAFRRFIGGIPQRELS
ncbi:cobalamin B12-binding domain-containing protein [Streptomyces sp. NPDC018000]|uniref:cobalamin B12-binding domain-containing protein n=1 Tax=Streptomyces sp. NPDC018000 TaxID=3365028 RepID=UPI0037891FEF